MENYDRLKQVIQQANPEIMELKFGCQIKYGTDIFTFNGDKYEDRFSRFDYKETLVGVIEQQDDLVIADCKILGRPIRLADVLLVIWEYVPEVYSVLSNGDILNVDNEFVAKWNLKDDNLDHQSDETKRFLIELLTKK